MGLSLKRSFWPVDGRVQHPPFASNPAIVGCAPRGRCGFPAAGAVVRLLRAPVAGRGSPSATCERQTDRSVGRGTPLAGRVSSRIVPASALGTYRAASVGVLPD